MTKTAARLIYGKVTIKKKKKKEIIFSGTKWPMTLKVGMWHWTLKSYQICSNDELRWLDLFYDIFSTVTSSCREQPSFPWTTGVLLSFNPFLPCPHGGLFCLFVCSYLQSLSAWPSCPIFNVYMPVLLWSEKPRVSSMINFRRCIIFASAWQCNSCPYILLICSNAYCPLRVRALETFDGSSVKLWNTQFLLRQRFSKV